MRGDNQAAELSHPPASDRKGRAMQHPPSQHLSRPASAQRPTSTFLESSASVQEGARSSALTSSPSPPSSASSVRLGKLDASRNSPELQLPDERPVVVLRRCDDVHVRTGGFQKIEEAAHRMDQRRRGRRSD